MRRRRPSPSADGPGTPVPGTGGGRPKTGGLFLYWPVPLIVGLDWAGKWMAEQMFGGVKTLLPGLLRFNTVHHYGALFGYLDGASNPGTRWVIHAVSLACLSVLVILAARTPSIKKMRHTGFACMIGGALGNMGNRMFCGHVTDFIQLGPLPIINGADLALLAGILLILADLGFEKDEGITNHASRSF